LACLLRRSKNWNKEESGKEDFRIDDRRKKGVHFFGKGYCEKCTGMKQWRKRRTKKIYCKIEMPIILSKEVVLKHPCIPCAGSTRMVIRDKYENRGRSWGGGRGRYEARRVKGAFSVITCNLTASATHLLVSAVPRI
jgi:hypothetical protein